MSLPCGHLIHTACMQGLTDINCPVCGMAMQKMSAQQNAHIQQLIDSTKDKLPEEVKNHKVNILCNECLHKTNDAPFHFYGIKCGNCGTFNTKMI
jgi:RING finger/CHY zinc finger protein 1